MKKRLVPLLFALALFVPIAPFLNGCAYLHSTTSKDKLGIEETKTTVYTLFDSHSDMTKYSAKINEKSSGTTIGNIDQSSSSTNILAAIQALAKLGLGAAAAP